MFRKLIPLLAAPAIVGAQQTRPQTATPAGSMSTQQMADTTFRQISLADALRLAHDNNVQNITAENSIRSANNLVRSARAQLYPNLTGSLSQNKVYGSRLGEGNNLIAIDSRWGYSTSLTSQVTLFDAGKTFADVRTQKANVAAAEATEVNTEFGVAFNVKEAYYAVLFAKESESAAQQQLETAQLQLQTSIAKVNAGAANVSDSLRSVVQVGNAQLALLTARETFRTQSAALTRLVGTNYFVTANLADTVEHLAPALDSAQIMAFALNGPTIRANEASVNAASASTRSAKAAYLPTIGANLTFGGSGTNAIYGLNDNPFPYSRGVSISLNYPIFNRFQRENQVSAAQISYDNAQAQLRDSKLAAQQNVITGIASLRNAEETMRVQEQNVRASEEDLRVQQQRYNLGASVLLDVLNSQLTLVQARQSLIQARFNYRNARAQIEAAIGRDLPQ
jgi:outer membrane protein